MTEKALENIEEIDRYLKPIAREGEQQFACILRNRSGVSSGEIDFAARLIHKLPDIDQQDAVDAAFNLYKNWCTWTGKKSTLDKSV